MTSLLRSCLIMSCIWLTAGCARPAGDPAKGRELFLRPAHGKQGAPGCKTCHSLQPGEEIVGPSLADVGYRASARILEPGYSGEANTAEDYLRESILEPNAHIVGGFDPGVMYGNFAEVFSNREVDHLVAFLSRLE